MKRKNSLYIDVLGVSNIVAAIDLAEEQLFRGIDHAMSCNVVGDPASYSEQAITPVVASDAAVASKSIPRLRDNRQESAAAYSALAAKVDARGHAPGTADKGTEDCFLPASIEIRQQARTPESGDAKSTMREATTVSENIGTFIAEKDHLKELSTSTASRQWNSSLKPSRSLLSKREKANQKQKGHDSDSASGLAPAATVPAIRSFASENRNTGTHSVSSIASTISRGTQSDGQREEGKLDVEMTTSFGNIDDEQGAEELLLFRADSELNHAPSSQAHCLDEKFSKRKEPNLVRSGSESAFPAGESGPPKVDASTVVLGTSLKPHAPLESSNLSSDMSRSHAIQSSQRDSVPTSKVDLTSKNPGVMFVPGVDPIGSVQPNGYRVTTEGLRPVVTLDPRPKAPHQLRQTMANKLFEALSSAGISEMDSVVRSIVTEQRYVSI